MNIWELYYFVITIISTIATILLLLLLLLLQLLLLLLLLSLLVISHLLTLFDCCHLTNKGVYIITNYVVPVPS